MCVSAEGNGWKEPDVVMEAIGMCDSKASLLCVYNSPVVSVNNTSHTFKWEVQRRPVSYYSSIIFIDIGEELLLFYCRRRIVDAM